MMKLELEGLSFKYQRAAADIAARLGSPMPSMKQVREGKMETYRRSSKKDGNKEFIPKFPYLSIEYKKAPINMRHVRMARGRTGWQVILFDPQVFIDWVNSQPETQKL